MSVGKGSLWHRIRGAAVATATVATVLLGGGPAFAKPANDDFASALEASAIPFSHATDTKGATLEHGEPQPSCARTRTTVWYRFTPSASGDLVASTFGSKFDTVMAAYTGTGFADLAEAACNDDAIDVGSQQSRISFEVEAARTYFFQVGGLDHQTGSLVFGLSGNLGPPVPSRIEPAYPRARSDSYCEPLLLESCAADASASKDTGAVSMDLEVSAPAGGAAPGLDTFAVGYASFTASHTISKPVPELLYTVVLHVDSAMAARSGSTTGEGYGLLSMYVSAWHAGCSCYGDSDAIVVDADGSAAPSSRGGEDLRLQMRLADESGDALPAGEVEVHVSLYGTAYLLADTGSVSTDLHGTLSAIEIAIPSPSPAAPSIFMNYPAPETDLDDPEGFRYSHRSGETSIGVNPRTNNAMFQMRLDTARVHWDDSQSPAVATWENVTDPTISPTTLDPILWTDRTTGRTFVAHLAGEFSLAAYTDDDGANWHLVQPPTAAPSFDHETIGGGPYAQPAPARVDPSYPNAIYYCAQAGAPVSQCARSDDGGLTWGPPLPMNVAGCQGLHGHAVVAPDGTVYVPHKNCYAPPDQAPLQSSGQGLLLSTNNGLTWERRVVPGTRVVPSSLPGVTSQLSDPALAVDAGGRIYFVASSEGKAVVATSDDRAETWTPLVDIGAPFGVQNVEFPMAVAGDAGRAAVAFYGTPAPGLQDEGFNGIWHLYVAFTFDGGATWETFDATPTDPVHRGCIDCPDRRPLLDFQGMTVDAEGRVLVGYADGCTSQSCVGPGGMPWNSDDQLGTIARQTSGKRLFAAFDPPTS